MLPERGWGWEITRTTWARAAVVCWALVLLVLCVKAALAPQRQSVLPIYIHAGANWLEGKGLYGSTSAAHDVFRYSPLAAALFAPASLLPDAVAAVLWRLLNAGVLILGIRWWLRELLPNRLTKAQEGMLFLLVLPLAIGNLNNGQANPLLVGLVLAAVAAVKQQRFTLAGVCVALAFWLKLFPLAVGLLLVLLYTRRFSPRWLVALGVGCALPFLLQNPGYVFEEYRHWVEYLHADDRLGQNLGYWPRDIRLLMMNFGLRLAHGVYPMLQLGVAALIACCCFAAQRRQWPEREVLLWLTHLSCCWMTTFGPAVESTTWIVLVPSLATMLVLAFVEPSPRWVRAFLLLSFGLSLLAQMALWVPQGNWLNARGIQPAAGVLAFLCVLGIGWKRFRSRQGQETHQEGRSLAAAA